MTVRVAIDLALDRLFDYTVPEALQEKLAVGQLLSVPFGHREARGFAMAITADAPPVGRASSPCAAPLPPVGRASSPCAVAPVGRSVPDRRAGEREISRLESHESLESLEPPSDPSDQSDQSDKSFISPSSPPSPLHPFTPSPFHPYLISHTSYLISSPITLRPITAIVDPTPFFSPELLALVKRVAAYTASPIESVLRAALPAAVLKKNAKPRELLYLEPALAPTPVALTKRQQWLYDQIVRLGGGWMSQLCEELKTTNASLRQLGALGLVKVAVRARRRDPLAGRRVLPTKPLPLNAEQQAALDKIAAPAPAAPPLPPVGRASSPCAAPPPAPVGRASSPCAVAPVGRSVPDRRAGERDFSRLESHESLEPSSDPSDPSDPSDKSFISPSSAPQPPKNLISHLSSPISPAPQPPQKNLISHISYLISSPFHPFTLSPFHPLLLFGVTGSGKTEVYLQAIARELDANRGAIVMVPEISLTPQTVRRFASRFGDRVAVLHSALSDGERYDEWHRIRAGEARVVVGPRSAVWAPVKNLGLIVVDEEHEGSYKQDEMPRYNARDVAVLRGAIEGAKVVLGSATPSLETWANVKSGKYAIAELTHRAGHGSLPIVHLVDRAETRSDGKGGGAIFSMELLDAIKLRLDRHEQTILFLNRRGYSKSVTCADCGNVVICPRCSTPDRGVPYTYHRADSCLRCHICGDWTQVPNRCPACGGAHLDYRGVGTQRAEAALQKCFPRARVLRMDADSTSRKQSHDDILGAFGRHEADILIGTQMIAKGLDFPNVTLVGVLNADSSLNLSGSDFRAAERTYQLISQVAGRAGRAELPGEVFVQTYDPTEPAIALAAKGDYREFAERELKIRQSCGLPPSCRLAVMRLRSKDLRQLSDWSAMYAASLKGWKGITVSEAMPSALERADEWYRWMIVIRAPASSSIVRAWRWLISVRPPPSTLKLSIDIDAINLV